MNTNPASRRNDRIHDLARSVGEERSLYLGEAIGNTLAIAWNAFGALGAWLTRRGSASAPARARAAE